MYSLNYILHLFNATVSHGILQLSVINKEHETEDLKKASGETVVKRRQVSCIEHVRCA